MLTSCRISIYIKLSPRGNALVSKAFVADNDVLAHYFHLGIACIFLSFRLTAVNKIMSALFLQLNSIIKTHK